MKKLMLMGAFAVFGLSNVNAQDDSASKLKVTFGAKAGVNFATVGGDETGGTSSRTAFHVGGVAEIAISEKFSVQPELLYSAQGAVRDFEGVDVDVKLDYLNIPIMAKYYVADGFSVEAGPQIGLLLSAEADGGGETEDLKDSISGIDFGLGIGAGYKMESGLNFSARYNLGISNINDFEGSDDISNQNNVFQISVGYFFN